MSTLKNLGEFSLIQKIVGDFSFPGEIVGPGDDCAVIPMSDFGLSQTAYLLVSTDAYVENVHFKREFSSPEDIGHKIFAATLSDVAAMGGNPHSLFVSLQAPSSTEAVFIEEVYQTLRSLADEFGVKILGGDTVSSQTLAFSLTVLGSSDSKPILRSTAKDGDQLWHSGEIGSSFAGFRALSQGLELEDNRRFIDKHLRPSPRIELAKAIMRSGLATSMIDVSDGLLQDAAHIAEQSDLGIELDPSKVNVSAQLLSKFSHQELLSGGEDFELLFTAPASKHEQVQALSSELYCIGELKVSPDSSIIIKDQNANLVSLLDWSKNQGYNHFT